MPIHYSIDKKNRVVYLTAEGRAVHDDFADVIDRLAEDTDFEPGTHSSKSGR